MSQLKISARNAGQVELEKYCPRCCWYLLHLKKMPFQFGMPGVMFYMEAAEKAFLLAYLAKFRLMPDYFGPFANCTEPVEFPFSMAHEHSETGVMVTAQADMMIRRPNGTICLLDLKTSKPDGGGKVFLPQYEVQVIGYSWVTQQAGVGTVSKAGLVYCDIQVEQFKAQPLKYKTSTGIMVPFDFMIHEVKLDFTRLTKCLKEVKKVWNAERPPQGTDGCKDCALLTRLLDADHEQQMTDHRTRLLKPECRNYLNHQDHLRNLTRHTTEQLEDILSADAWEQEGGMWANWDFS